MMLIATPLCHAYCIATFIYMPPFHMLLVIFIFAPFHIAFRLLRHFDAYFLSAID